MRKGDKEMNKNIIKTALILSLAVTINTFAASEADIEKLERDLINIENQLMTPELRLDDLQKERSAYDGLSGLFQISKKKALDTEISNQETEVNKLASQMRNLTSEIQAMVFEVAKSFEKKGNYDKAIEYYLKVTPIKDNVRERIAACYKAKKDYQQAIKWLLEMSRTDVNLLEVVDCYHLDNCSKQAIYWLFEILEPFANNAAEKAALKLIEEYKYKDLLTDYPDFYVRLSNVYIEKAFKNYGSDSTVANADYKKAVQLRSKEDNSSLSTISLKIVGFYKDKYSEAMEVLNRQRDAAERNYRDKLHDAEEKLQDAEYRLRMARSDSERHYQNELRRAEDKLRRVESELRAVESNPNATDGQKNTARNNVNSAKRDLDKMRNEKGRIIHDYLSPYEFKVRNARDEKDKLVRDRERIIEDYIAPYKKKVAEAKKVASMVTDLHKANF